MNLIEELLANGDGELLLKTELEMPTADRERPDAGTESAGLNGYADGTKNIDNSHPAQGTFGIQLMGNEDGRSQ